METIQCVCPCGVMMKAMDCRIVICEFELQSRYHVHFRTNTLGKGMNLPNLSVRKYQCCSSRKMALALNIPESLICH